MKRIIKLDAIKSSVHDGLNDLLDWLEEANTKVVSSPLRYKHHNHPDKLMGDVSPLPDLLYKADKEEPAVPCPLLSLLLGILLLLHSTEPPF